jgi:eukaryotic-like serine/threonine-protein kinase
MDADAAPTQHAIDRSSWFLQEGELLGALRRESGRVDVEIPGYEHLRELKRGGQGIVFSAIQTGTKRRVAIKILLDAAGFSESGRRRFEREVDLAAGLRHPGIVRVYDSGVAAGRAFLVMEFVDGVPLDEHVQRLDGDVRRILELMAKVCDAVQHAHTRGVIHRDLKPSNIRVEDSGEPRVLDFGLAKISDATRTDRGGAGAEASARDATLTTSGQFLGSLPWASPEQARGLPDQVDTRSDVYSLGAVTYQMVTGHLPLDVTGPLHTALSNIVSLPATPARARRQGLDEQVEIILAKALAKDPVDRYQSAGELAEDIRHYLAGEPIRAQRESAWRSLRRNARRYRTIAWLAGVSGLGLAGLGAWALHSASVAQEQRDAAQAALTRSDATVKFLTDLLGSASPDRSGGGRSTRVVELLDKAAAEVPVTYKDDPLTQVALLDLLGRTYSKLEMFDEADRQFLAVIHLADTRGDVLTDPMVRLGAMGNRASMFGQQGRNDESMEMFRTLVAEYDRLGIRRHSNLAASLSDMGVMSRRANRLDDADRYYARAAEATPTDQRDSLGYVILTANRAMLLEAMGRVEEAIVMCRQALALCEKVMGPDSLQTNTTRSNLAFLLITAGRPGEGLPLMEQALATAERSAGESHRTTLILMNNLGKSYQDQGEHERALALYDRAIHIYRTQREPGDPGIFPPTVNRIATLNELGRGEEALSDAMWLLEATAGKGGEAAFDHCNANNAVASTLERLGRVTDAEPYFRRSVQLSGPEGGVLPPGHWRHEQYRAGLAGNLILQGRLDEADAILPGAYDKLLSALSPRHPVVKKAASIMAKLRRAQGREADALPFDQAAAK